jgi:hypothetical protein
MTIEQINAMVETIGLPFSYYEFPEGTSQAPPFVVWFLSRDDDLKADNINYCDIEWLNIELYTSNKNFDLDKKIEDVLKANDLTYYKESSFIDSEKIWQTSFEMEVMINES